MRLSEAEKAELKELANSAELRRDMELMSQRRRNPFVTSTGEVDVDRFIAFLTEYNRFLGHPRKPFRKFYEHDMRL